MREPPPFGTVEMARDNLACLVGGVIAHASVVQIYADAGYHPGMILAAKNTAAYLRALLGAIQEFERSEAVVTLRERTADIGPGQGV